MKGQLMNLQFDDGCGKYFYHLGRGNLRIVDFWVSWDPRTLVIFGNTEVGGALAVSGHLCHRRG